MLVPPKKNDPLLEQEAAPTPAKMQTRSMSAAKREHDEQLDKREKELMSYLGSDVTTSAEKRLAAPGARAAHVKRLEEMAPRSLARLEHMMENLLKEADPDTRTPEEVLHDLAVTTYRTSHYR
jgi:hypothetical protein